MKEKKRGCSWRPISKTTNSKNGCSTSCWVRSVEPLISGIHSRNWNSSLNLGLLFTWKDNLQVLGKMLGGPRGDGDWTYTSSSQRQPSIHGQNELSGSKMPFSNRGHWCDPSFRFNFTSYIKARTEGTNNCTKLIHCKDWVGRRSKSSVP